VERTEGFLVLISGNNLSRLTSNHMSLSIIHAGE